MSKRRRTYIVVRGEHSDCGIHPGSKSWRECPHCARAAALTAAALATVVPIPAERTGAPATRSGLSDEDVVRIREMATAGAGPTEISRTIGKRRQTVYDVIRGKAHRLTTAERRERDRKTMTGFILESPAAKRARQALVPLRERSL